MGSSADGDILILAQKLFQKQKAGGESYDRAAICQSV
jgi:hypothetical protein